MTHGGNLNPFTYSTGTCSGNACPYHYLPSLPVTYTAGDVYTFNISTSNGSISGSVTAPGGPASVTQDFSYIAWPVAGNYDYVLVTNDFNYGYGYAIFQSGPFEIGRAHV